MIASTRFAPAERAEGEGSLVTVAWNLLHRSVRYGIKLLGTLVSLSRLTIFLPGHILDFFLAGSKKLSGGLDGATIAHVVSLFRQLLMPLRCQSESIRWAIQAALPLSLDKRAIAEPRRRAYFLNRAASSEPPVTLPAL